MGSPDRHPSVIFEKGPADFRAGPGILKSIIERANHGGWAITMDPAKRIEEALYVSIGLGVLAFNKAQVRRREIEALVKSRAGDDADPVTTAFEIARAVPETLYNAANEFLGNSGQH